MARQFILLAALVLGVVGTTFADETEKIVGGTDAFLGEFPYQVSLRQGSFHFCGGALISDQEVLTAAHCVVGKTAPFDFVVVTGTISTKAGGQTHRIKEIFIHEGYINDLAESLKNDIAIIRLASPYLPHIYQSAIPLPSYQMPDKAPLTVSGWGMINNKGEVPDILQKATVYALSNDMCRNLVPEVTKIFGTNLCALNRRGIGVCPGDSGGPLTYEGQVVGIVSMGYPCGLGIPDIYTRVTEYLDFINGILKKD